MEQLSLKLKSTKISSPFDMGQEDENLRQTILHLQRWLSSEINIGTLIYREKLINIIKCYLKLESPSTEELDQCEKWLNKEKSISKSNQQLKDLLLIKELNVAFYVKRKQFLEAITLLSESISNYPEHLNFTLLYLDILFLQEKFNEFFSIILSNQTLNSMPSIQIERFDRSLKYWEFLYERLHHGIWLKMKPQFEKANIKNSHFASTLLVEAEVDFEQFQCIRVDALDRIIRLLLSSLSSDQTATRLKEDIRLLKNQVLKLESIINMYRQYSPPTTPSLLHQQQQIETNTMINLLKTKSFYYSGIIQDYLLFNHNYDTKSGFPFENYMEALSIKTGPDEKNSLVHKQCYAEIARQLVFSLRHMDHKKYFIQYLKDRKDDNMADHYFEQCSLEKQGSMLDVNHVEKFLIADIEMNDFQLLQSAPADLSRFIVFSLWHIKRTSNNYTILVRWITQFFQSFIKRLHDIEQTSNSVSLSHILIFAINLIFEADESLKQHAQSLSNDCRVFVDQNSLVPATKSNFNNRLWNSMIHYSNVNHNQEQPATSQQSSTRSSMLKLRSNIKSLNNNINTPASSNKSKDIFSMTTIMDDLKKLLSTGEGLYVDVCHRIAESLPYLLSAQSDYQSLDIHSLQIKFLNLSLQSRKLTKTTIDHIYYVLGEKWKEKKVLKSALSCFLKSDTPNAYLETVKVCKDIIKLNINNPSYTNEIFLSLLQKVHTYLNKCQNFNISDLEKQKIDYSQYVEQIHDLSEEIHSLEQQLNLDANSSNSSQLYSSMVLPSPIKTPMKSSVTTPLRIRDGANSSITSPISAYAPDRPLYDSFRSPFRASTADRREMQSSFRNQLFLESNAHQHRDLHTDSSFAPTPSKLLVDSSKPTFGSISFNNTSDDSIPNGSSKPKPATQNQQTLPVTSKPVATVQNTTTPTLQTKPTTQPVILNSNQWKCECCDKVNDIKDRACILCMVENPNAPATAVTSSDKSVFGPSASATSSFGGSSTSTQSLFGNTSAPATKPSTLFGGSTFTATTTPAPSLFGNTSTATTTPVPSLFGNTSAPATKPSTLFGGSTSTTTTPAPSLFGNTSTATTTPVPSLFGNTSTTTTTSLFGSTSTTAPITTPLFGSTTATVPSTTPVSLFGSTTTVAASTTTPSSLFGSATTPNSITTKPIFGSTNNDTTPSFGNTTTTTSLFGKTSSAPTTGSSTTSEGFKPSGFTPSFGGGGFTFDPNAASVSIITETKLNEGQWKCACCETVNEKTDKLCSICMVPPAEPKESTSKPTPKVEEKPQTTSSTPLPLFGGSTSAPFNTTSGGFKPSGFTPSIGGGGFTFDPNAASVSIITETKLSEGQWKCACCETVNEKTDKLCTICMVPPAEPKESTSKPTPKVEEKSSTTPSTSLPLFGGSTSAPFNTTSEGFKPSGFTPSVGGGGFTFDPNAASVSIITETKLNEGQWKCACCETVNEKTDKLCSICMVPPAEPKESTPKPTPKVEEKTIIESKQQEAVKPAETPKSTTLPSLIGSSTTSSASTLFGNSSAGTSSNIFGNSSLFGSAFSFNKTDDKPATHFGDDDDDDDDNDDEDEDDEDEDEDEYDVSEEDDQDDQDSEDQDSQDEDYEDEEQEPPEEESDSEEEPNIVDDTPREKIQVSFGSLSSNAPPKATVFGTVPSNGSVFGSTPTNSSATSVFGSSTSAPTSVFGSSTSTKPSSTSVFGGDNNSSTKPNTSVFGSSTAPASVFGSSTPSSSAPASVFGSSTPAPTATSAPASVFGSSTSVPSSGSVFGNSTSSVFGGNKTVTPSSTTSVFGSTSAPASVFGSSTPAPSAPSTPASVFGSSKPAPSAPASVFGSTSVFGSSKPAPSAPASVFGSSTSTGSVFGNSSVFGGNSNSTSSSSTTSVFGNTSASVNNTPVSVFGNTSASTLSQSGGSIFGNQTTTTNPSTATKSDSPTNTESEKPSIFGTKPTISTSSILADTPKQSPIFPISPTNDFDSSSQPTFGGTSSVLGKPAASIFGGQSKPESISIFGDQPKVENGAPKSIFGNDAPSSVFESASKKPFSPQTSSATSTTTTPQPTEVKSTSTPAAFGFDSSFGSSMKQATKEKNDDSDSEDEQSETTELCYNQTIQLASSFTFKPSTTTEEKKSENSWSNTSSNWLNSTAPASSSSFGSGFGSVSSGISFGSTSSSPFIQQKPTQTNSPSLESSKFADPKSGYVFGSQFTDPSKPSSFAQIEKDKINESTKVEEPVKKEEPTLSEEIKAEEKGKTEESNVNEIISTPIEESEVTSNVIEETTTTETTKDNVSVVVESDDEEESTQKEESNNVVVESDEDPDTPKQLTEESSNVVVKSDEDPDTPKQSQLNVVIESNNVVVESDEDPDTPKQSQSNVVVESDEDPDTPKQSQSTEESSNVTVESDDDQDTPKQSQSTEESSNVVVESDEDPDTPKQSQSNVVVESDEDPDTPKQSQSTEESSNVAVESDDDQDTPKQSQSTEESSNVVVESDKDPDTPKQSQSNVVVESDEAPDTPKQSYSTEETNNVVESDENQDAPKIGVQEIQDEDQQTDSNTVENVDKQAEEEQKYDKNEVIESKEDLNTTTPISMSEIGNVLPEGCSVTFDPTLFAKNDNPSSTLSSPHVGLGFALGQLSTQLHHHQRSDAFSQHKHIDQEKVPSGSSEDNVDSDDEESDDVNNVEENQSNTDSKIDFGTPSFSFTPLDKQIPVQDSKLPQTSLNDENNAPIFGQTNSIMFAPQLNEKNEPSQQEINLPTNYVFGNSK